MRTYELLTKIEAFADDIKLINYYSAIQSKTSNGLNTH